VYGDGLGIDWYAKAVDCEMGVGIEAGSAT
jgi:hypothetical protein